MGLGPGTDEGSCLSTCPVHSTLRIKILELVNWWLFCGLVSRLATVDEHVVMFTGLVSNRRDQLIITIVPGCRPARQKCSVVTRVAGGADMVYNTLQ